MKDVKQAGFTYIDVMCALVILMIGILGLLSGISVSILQSRGQEQQLLAKQITTSTMESIFSVKETDPLRMGWNAIGNIGSNPNTAGVGQGIFVIGFKPVFLNAGPDEVIGTADDNGPLVTDLQRRIVIKDVCDPDRPSSICNPAGTFPIRKREIEVIVTYNVGAVQRQEVLVSGLADYAVVN